MANNYKPVFDTWLNSERLPDEFYKLDSITTGVANKRGILSTLTKNENARGETKATLIGALCAVIGDFVKLLNGENTEKLHIGTYETDEGTSCIASYLRGDGFTEVATYSPFVSEDGCAFKIALINAEGNYVKATFADTDHSCFGTALYGAILSQLLMVSEFARGITALRNKTEMDENTADLYGILCDVAFRCTSNPETNAKGVPSEYLINGNRAGARIPLLTEEFINTVECNPLTVDVEGESVEMNQINLYCTKPGEPAKKQVSKKFKDQRKRMVELGAYTEEDWAEELRELIPLVDANDTVPDKAIEIAETYLMSLSSPCPVNAFMLKGEAGSGKSTICHKYVPALLGMPCVIFSGNPDLSASELLVSLQPKSDVLGADGKLVSNYKTTSAKWSDLTSEEEIMNDPVTAWSRLTGEQCAKATSFDCFRYIASNYAGGAESAKFVAVKSAIVTAAELGFCCEIQELDIVRDAGVPAALNSLLEEGVISMPNGERVYRNPRNIMFFTVNEDYIGCNEVNQALLDRIPVKDYLDTPPKKVLVERVKKETGCTDDTTLGTMADFMQKLKTYCSDSGIVNGTVGYRSFKAWVQAYMFNPQCKGSLYKSALCTVMTSASQTRELVTLLTTNVLNVHIKNESANKRERAAANATAIPY